MFGELIGLFPRPVLAGSGRPDPFVLAEIGPGRGTLMADALRALKSVSAGGAARAHLVETSPTLRARQAAMPWARLSPHGMTVSKTCPKARFT
ncbi:MAG: SAM-dependent methyltransferase [Defluviimonas denitrificans]